MRALLYSLLLSSILVASSQWIMFKTMGHAGPEGRFAGLGWIATIINFPGLVMGGWLQSSAEDSTSSMELKLLLYQLPFIWYPLFVVFRLLRRKYSR